VAVPVLMPQIGENLETAFIESWAKGVNEAVTEGEVVCVVETDKALLEIEAPASGVMLKLLYEEGDEAPVLEPIAYIGQPGETLAEEEAG